MAELDIGDHCSVAECKQLDFLPIQCSKCGKIFCKLHAAYDNHSCPLADRPTEDSLPAFGPTSFACDLTNCPNRELTPIQCDGCKKNFCLQHRHPADHYCSSESQPLDKMQQTKEHVERILAEKNAVPPKKKKPLSKKACATAAKVTLMKIKMKAVGDRGIPEAEKFYCLVCLPKGAGKDRQKAVCFSKKWTIGRAVDHVASLAGVVNKNNIAGADKLCLFDGREGHLLPFEQTFEALTENDEFYLFSGSSVIMEYAKEPSDSSVAVDDYK